MRGRGLLSYGKETWDTGEKDEGQGGRCLARVGGRSETGGGKRKKEQKAMIISSAKKGGDGLVGKGGFWRTCRLLS